jgi:16S rRNA (guanine966-N2)-methyltransferase
VVANRVRIIGGEWRRRWIKFPDMEGLRPTPDRVRETVFNWLGQDLSGLTCLDLYAGSGAFGFEAASRGASEVILVEHSRRVTQALKDNAALLCGQPSRFCVVCADALEFLAREQRRYDVVFVDPPYAVWQTSPDAVDKVLNRLRPRLNSGARIYLEAAQPLQLPQDWQTIKNNRAGAVYFQLAQPIAQ